MKYPTLKEAYMIEDQQTGGSSRFVSSMRKQFGRARDQETLDHVGRVYNNILALVQEQDPQKQQQVLATEEPLFKFHFRIAWKEVQDGVLDPNAVPSSKDIITQELEKRNVAQAARRQQAQSIPAQTPGEKAAAERQAVYGGDPQKRPWGLGT